MIADPGGPGLAGLGSESVIDVKAARHFAELQRRAPVTSAKWGVHIYAKYAEYTPVSILHIENGFAYFLTYCFAYSAYYFAYFLSYSAYCLHISCYILHIILHIYFHILYSAYYFAYFLAYSAYICPICRILTCHYSAYYFTYFIAYSAYYFTYFIAYSAYFNVYAAYL